MLIENNITILHSAVYNLGASLLELLVNARSKELLESKSYRSSSMKNCALSFNLFQGSQKLEVMGSDCLYQAGLKVCLYFVYNLIKANIKQEIKLRATL